MEPNALIRRVLAALGALLMAACVAYPTAPYPAVPAGPSAFDRSWDAALGAAADVGVQVVSADRASGRISGSKGGTAIAIEVQTRADGRVQVGFNAPGAAPSNPALVDQLSQAYNRRMGR
jgi:hypothetical protein